MNIGSLGVSLQSSMTSEGASATVMGKVLDQEKVDGQDAEALIESAAPQGSGGHSLSVYA